MIKRRASEISSGSETASSRITGLLLLMLIAKAAAAAPADGLVAHLPLTHDCRDSSGQDNHGKNHGVTFQDGAAHFDGVDAYIKIADSPSLAMGTTDCTISVRVHTRAIMKDVVGDILSKFDAATRTGLNFSVMNYTGTSDQSNHRNVFFGIDSGHAEPSWVDCGQRSARQPGMNSVYQFTV